MSERIKTAMARYIGPVCRLCRREGMKLFLKGERCFTEKCAIEKREPAARPARQGAQGQARWATACSCARSRRSSASTACSRTSSAATSRRPSATRGHHRRDAAAAARAAPRQRRLPPRLRDLARAGAPAGAPRPLPGQRQEGRHPVVLGQGRRRGERARGQRARTPPIVHAIEEVKGRGVPDWLDARRRPAHRPCRVAADARADQPARPGAADRRAVLEVRRVRRVLCAALSST